MAAQAARSTTTSNRDLVRSYVEQSEENADLLARIARGLSDGASTADLDKLTDEVVARAGLSGESAAADVRAAALSLALSRVEHVAARRAPEYRYGYSQNQRPAEGGTTGGLTRFLISELQTLKDSGEMSPQIDREPPAEGRSRPSDSAREAGAERVGEASSEATPLAYELKELDSEYVGKKDCCHLSEQERAIYELTVKDGRLYTASGQLFDTRSAVSNHSGDGFAIFVMAPDGKLYASLSHRRFKHPSFLAGGPVAAAGELEVRDGVIVTISDRSGHYLPGPQHTAQALRRLMDLGVSLDDVQLHLWDVGAMRPLEFLAARDEQTRSDQAGTAGGG